MYKVDNSKKKLMILEENKIVQSTFKSCLPQARRNILATKDRDTGVIDRHIN